mmetsp:Transcript_3466/g.6859  ORF Transcript_3466/g.6859 Transcript_3466/m.6859 type:complete len:156 (-) Transcript_3466:82-549(-)
MDAFGVIQDDQDGGSAYKETWKWDIPGDSWVGDEDYNCEENIDEAFDDPLDADPQQTDDGLDEDDSAACVDMISHVGPKENLPLVRAVADYISDEVGDLSFCEGDVLTVVEKRDSGWWQGWLLNSGLVESKDRQTGWFPCTYVEWLPKHTLQDES